MTGDYVVSAIAWLAAIVAGAIAWRFQTILRRVRTTSILPIPQMRSGLVKFNGRIYPLDRPLVSPATRSSCVWYRFTVREKRRRRWRQVTDSQTVASVVRDGSGEVHVVPNYRSLNLKPDFQRGYGPLTKLEPSAAEFLSTTYGFKRRSWWTLVCQETALDVGAEVFVFGTLVLESDGRRRLVDKGSIISDKGEEAVVHGLFWTSRILAASAAAGVLYGTWVLLFLTETI